MSSLPSWGESGFWLHLLLDRHLPGKQGLKQDSLIIHVGVCVSLVSTNHEPACSCQRHQRPTWLKLNKPRRWGGPITIPMTTSTLYSSRFDSSTGFILYPRGGAVCVPPNCRPGTCPGLYTSPPDELMKQPLRCRLRYFESR